MALSMDWNNIPTAKQKRLNALGHDFFECRREGVWLFDEKGNRYLDADSGAGVFNLGRRPPELAQALLEAMQETDQGNFPMISEEKALLAQALSNFLPGSLDCVVYSVMRGEALDFACKVARGYTKRQKLVTVEGAYYGESGFALSLSQGAEKAHYGPLIPETAGIPFGDLKAAKKILTQEVAAMILEPIQAENGCRIASTSYVQGLAQYCKQAGVLLILDESQSNFGRTGAPFAYQELEIAPDLLLLGEALGGGMFPIAATLLSQQVNQFMNAHPMIHLSTFGGSDIACRVALRALSLYQEKEAWKNAAIQGQHIEAELGPLISAPHCPLRALNGKGLLRALLFDHTDQATAFCKAAAAQGLFVCPGRLAQHSVLLRPSLLIQDDEVDWLIKAITKALNTMQA